MGTAVQSVDYRAVVGRAVGISWSSTSHSSAVSGMVSGMVSGSEINAIFYNTGVKTTNSRKTRATGSSLHVVATNKYERILGRH